MILDKNSEAILYKLLDFQKREPDVPLIVRQVNMFLTDTLKMSQGEFYASVRNLKNHGFLADDDKFYVLESRAYNYFETEKHAPLPQHTSEVHIGSINLADSSQAIVGTISGGNVSLENRQEVNFDLLEKLIQTKSEEDQKLLKEMLQELKRIAESSDPVPKSFLSKFGKKLHELTDLLVPVGTILLQIFTA